MPKAAVIGAGLIGRSWAVVFARAGWSVAITDTDPAALEWAPVLMSESMALLAEFGLCDDPAAALARIALVPSLEKAVVGADLVQECGPEQLAAKQALFQALDAAAPSKALLASSSSAIVASLYTADLPGRDRCLVAHPVNPPHLVPIVELCAAPWVPAKTVERARRLYEQAGQVPVTVKREVEGFVVNRLQGALLTEGLRLVGEGIISPQDLDKTLADGLGLRWALIGPFATIELNAPGGIPDYCARFGGFYRRLAAEPPAPSVWDAENVAQVEAAWGPPPAPKEALRRSAARDRRIAALVAAKRSH
ncbi:3-hydroxyacyl-CoA dehydrogenase [Aliidongia dinghuensis]|nr:3-hydroxyacyl-CoA dehydrogenase [Aliidongia dinghuensis]